MFLVRKGLMPDEQALIDMNKTVIELGEALKQNRYVLPVTFII